MNTAALRQLHAAPEPVLERTWLVTLPAAPGARPFADPARARVVCARTVDPAVWEGPGPLAWVLMPDHWQALVRAPDSVALEGALARFRDVAAQRLLHHGLWFGALWAPEWHWRELGAEHRLERLAERMVTTPVRAGLATDRGAYPFWDSLWL